ACRFARNDASTCGIFTLPHQMSPRLCGRSTIRLSSGLRPVFAPETVASAPLAVILSPAKTASSYSSATDELRYTRGAARPYFFKSNGERIEASLFSSWQQGQLTVVSRPFVRRNYRSDRRDAPRLGCRCSLSEQRITALLSAVAGV